MSQPSRSDRLGPLRVTRFRRFFFGEVINNAGSSMSGIALSFAVLHIDDSATALGWVAAAWTVPMVAFMLIGGALADRLPRATVLRGCNLVEGVTQAVAAALVLTGSAHVWELVVLQFVSGTVFSASYPAFHGMVPILLPESERKAAYLLLNQSQSALRIVGPAVAGVLVAVTNPGWGLAVDAATYFCAAWFLAILRLPIGERPDRQASVVGDFIAGWTFVRALGWVLPVACCSLVYNALTSGALSVLGPAISNGSIGSDGWGFSRAAEALGMFAFAFVLARTTIRRPLIAAQFGFVANAAPMLVLALWVHTVPLAAAFVVAGAGSALINLAWSLTVQEKVREDMLSRVMAIDGFFSFVAMPIGQILVGPSVHLLGTRGVELGAAGLCVLTCIAGCTSRPLRELRLGAEPALAAGPAEPVV